MKNRVRHGECEFEAVERMRAQNPSSNKCWGMICDLHRRFALPRDAGGTGSDRSEGGSSVPRRLRDARARESTPECTQRVRALGISCVFPHSYFRGVARKVINKYELSSGSSEASVQEDGHHLRLCRSAALYP